MASDGWGLTLQLGAKSFSLLVKAQVGKVRNLERKRHCKSPGCAVDNVRLEVREGIFVVSTVPRSMTFRQSPLPLPLE
jgi:hypothetical protein